MEHQDFKPVVLKKNSAFPVPAQRAPNAKALDNLNADETAPPKTFGVETGKLIQQARANKKLTRVQLAKSLNLQESVIRDCELGTAVYNGNLLARIKRALGMA
jgi:ribosome-binding protein aMBF1 (putative translation factor)